MSFWDSIKSAGSGLWNAAKPMIGSLAPMAGQALGSRFGPMGGAIGSQLGSAVGGMFGGGEPHYSDPAQAVSTAQGVMSALQSAPPSYDEAMGAVPNAPPLSNNQLGDYGRGGGNAPNYNQMGPGSAPPRAPGLSPNQLKPYMQGHLNQYLGADSQNTPFGQAGGHFGQKAGNYLGQQISQRLPQSMQGLGGAISQRLGQYGQQAGQWGQNQMQQRMGNRMPQGMGNRPMGNMSRPQQAGFQRSPMRREAQENMSNFNEMPFGGGEYSSPYDNYSPPQQQDQFENPEGPGYMDFAGAYARGGHVRRRPNLVEAMELMSIGG